jgi:hypothetical protein
MSEMKTRRELALLATGGVVAAGLIARATPAFAGQEHMIHARDALADALKSLNVADDNKGGHRVNAIHLIEQAVAEINAGIAFAAEHGD